MPTLAPIVVHVPTKIGGVRSVTESLADGIERNGREVIRAADVRQLMAARRSGATSAILSLESGYFSFLFQKSVYILHGFPVVEWYSPMRRVAVRLAARLARAGGSKMVAVSHLTRAIHERIYGIPVDSVIFNGCAESLHARAVSEDQPKTKRKQVAFVGRLIEGKGLRRIVRGFLDSPLRDAGYALRVAGSGPLAGWLGEVCAHHPEVQAVGEITEAQKEELLLESEAFVSLNDFEPMGVVFVEAVLARCKILAPYCGGHREFVPLDHPVALCDPTAPASVAAAFAALPRLASPRGLTNAVRFSYSRSIAQQYLDVLEGTGPARSAADGDPSTEIAL